MLEAAGVGGARPDVTVLETAAVCYVARINLAQEVMEGMFGYALGLEGVSCFLPPG